MGGVAGLGVGLGWREEVKKGIIEDAGVPFRCLRGFRGLGRVPLRGAGVLGLGMGGVTPS